MAFVPRKDDRYAETAHQISFKIPPFLKGSPKPYASNLLLVYRTWEIFLT